MSAQSRSVAHALNCQFFTMPQGNPGDAGEGRAWSVRRRGKDTSRDRRGCLNSSSGDAGEGQAWSVRRRGKDISGTAGRLFKFKRWG